MFSDVLAGRVDLNDPRAGDGRFGDNRMAHVTDGEVIIPKGMLASFPSLRDMLLGAFEESGIDPEEFVVGSEKSKVNPKTGQEEYWVGPAVAIGSSLIGNMMDRKDSQRANQAAQRGIAQAREQLEPYSDIGLEGMQDYASRIGEGFDYDDYRNSEGYNFALDEGMKAIDSKLNTSGLRNSGKAAKEGARYAQGLASQDFNNAFQRWLSENSQFAGLGNMGLGAAQGIGGLTNQAGQTQGQMHMANASNRNKMLGGLMDLAGTVYGPDFSSIFTG